MKSLGIEIKVNGNLVSRIGMGSKENTLFLAVEQTKQTGEEKTKISVMGSDTEFGSIERLLQHFLKHGESVSIKIVSMDFDTISQETENTKTLKDNKVLPVDDETLKYLLSLAEKISES